VIERATWATRAPSLRFPDANQAIPYGYLGRRFDAESHRLPYLNYGVDPSLCTTRNRRLSRAQPQAHTPLWHGAQYRQLYTFSKSIDDTSGIAPRASTLYSRRTATASAASASFIVRRASPLCDVGSFMIAVSARASVQHRQPLATAVAALADPVDRYDADGVPGTLSLATSTMQLLRTGGYDRPKFNRRQHLRRQPDAFGWLNPAAFTEAPPGYFGSVGPQHHPGPGIFAFDMKSTNSSGMPYRKVTRCSCGWKRSTS